MTLTKMRHGQIRKTGIPLSEITRNVADHQRPKSLFVPADQVAVLGILSEMLDELKEIKELLRRK